MRWLLAKGIRPFIRLAAFASLLLNLALLAPALYMLQVFDRVFASGSVETLVMLGLPVLVMLVLGYCMDAARARSLAAAGRRVENCLAPEALASQLEARAAGARRDDDALRDVSQLRKLLASPGVVALGKPSTVSTRRCWSPSLGSMPPRNGVSHRMASRCAGTGGTAIGWRRLEMVPCR